MELKEKLDFIRYREYQNKRWNSQETKEFFDLDFSKFLYENISNINNAQPELLYYFDFQEIFGDFNNGINDRQSFLIKFMLTKDVQGIDLLLKNMPYKLKAPFFYQIYIELKKDGPFLLSKIINCLENQNKLNFIYSIIDEINDDEILYLIRELYENRKDDILSNLLNNEKISNVVVDRVNAPFFYEMLEELYAHDNLKVERENNLKNIIINFQDYDINEIKKAYCDLYFHDIPKNVCLDIKTIIELANDDEIFKNQYLGDLYNVLCHIYTFLNSDREISPENVQLLKNTSINYNVVSKCFLMCQKRFKELVSDKINKDITENIKPTIFTSTEGKRVELYNIENQTSSQKNITMLVSTIPCSESAKLFKQLYYSDQNGEIKNGRRSCSLVNETKLLALFGGKNRITFGYDDLTGRNITSATLGDGGTDGNEQRFRRHRKVRKSSYLSVDNFIANTQHHTEVTVNMGTTGEVMKPSYILITQETPTPFEIDVAAEFGIPIKYVNVNKYDQVKDNRQLLEDYDYYSFQRNKISPKKIDVKTF